MTIESGKIPESAESESPSSGRTMRLYALAALACFFLAAVLYIVAKPVERTGPPVEERGVAPGDPHEGHDHTGHEHSGSAFAKELEELRGRVASGEAGADEVLALANILYDQGARSGSPGSEQGEAATSYFAESSELYALYLERVPENNDARTDYAYTLYRTGKLDRAIDELDQVRAADATHQNSAFNLAMMYVQKDRPDSVLHYLKITAALDSTTSAGRNALKALQTYTEAH